MLSAEVRCIISPGCSIKEASCQCYAFNAIIFITAQHGSSACDLARDQLSFKPSEQAAKGEGENRYGSVPAFNKRLHAALHALVHMDSHLQHAALKPQPRFVPK